MKKLTKNLIALLSIVLLTQTATWAQQTVSDFNLLNIDGQKMSLADNDSAKGFIIIFTCNHCPFAKKYENRIIALDKKYAPLGYPVVAINPNDATLVPEDSYEKMKIRAKEKGFTFPYLYDKTQTVAKEYGATRTPHVFIVVPKANKYQILYEGAIDDNVKNAKEANEKYVEEAIDALLKGKKIKNTETKAIGCTIKWQG